MMNKEVREKWITALTSGEYKQAKGALRKGDGFCCLGVLCDIAAKEGVVMWNGNFFDGCSGSLGAHVRGWADLDSSDPVLSDGNSLVELNDTMRVSFNQIADRIEAEL